MSDATSPLKKAYCELLMEALSERPYDIIVWGASGYTGGLICDYLAVRSNVTWAIAGRNKSTMEALAATLRRKHHLPESEPQYLIADIMDQQSMEKMVARGRCVIAIAGPFTHIGEAALKACLKTNTNYVDATAELVWSKKMREKYQEEASERQIRIIQSCGFDFVPNDMMMFQLDEHLRATSTSAGSDKRYSIHARKVTHAFAQSTPMVSGGTAMSGMALYLSLPFAKVVDYYISPYEMLSENQLVEVKESTKAANSFQISPTSMPHIKAYCTPFVMSSLMNKYIHWSNAHQNWRWGKELIYNGGEKRNTAFTAYLYSFIIWIQFFLVFLLSRIPWTWQFLPQPGHGPEINAKDAYMTSDLLAQVPRELPPSTGPEEEKIVQISWVYRGGEAYKCSAICLVEAAALIAQKHSELPEIYGFTSPSATLGHAYLKALESAGIEMKLETNV